MKKSYKVKRKKKKDELVEIDNVGSCEAVEGEDFIQNSIQKYVQQTTIQPNNEWVPSEKQMDVLRLWMDMDKRLSISELCIQAKIARTTWYKWKQDPNFRKYFQKLLLSEVEVEPVLEAWRCLHKAAKRGNVFAATKILEVTGLFTPKVKHEISGDPDNPIRTEVFVPQFNMPPPPSKRDRSGELECIDVEPLPLPAAAAEPKTFEQSLLEEDEDDEDI